MEGRGDQGHGATVSIFLLDGFRLYRDGIQLRVPDTGQRLIALLGLHPAALSRDFVAGLLWSDRTERQAHGSLRTTLWRVQKLCPNLLASSSYALAIAPDVAVDCRDVAQSARNLLAQPEQENPLAMDWPWQSAELLPGWYDDWVLFERERIRQLHLHALEAIARQLAACGRYGSALEAALRALRLEPLRESAHRLVMEVHLAEGNIHEALRQYRAYRRLLWQELQVPPSNELQALSRSLTQQPSKTPDARVKRSAGRPR